VNEPNLGMPILNHWFLFIGLGKSCLKKCLISEVEGKGIPKIAAPEHTHFKPDSIWYSESQNLLFIFHAFWTIFKALYIHLISREYIFLY